jgi:UDP-GlcNAc:undecaprenyl-phosphate GlcNAc-1-phosphate transferase
VTTAYVTVAYATVFAAAALSAVLLTPLSAWLGQRLGIADQPGGRRAHSGLVSRLGGIGLFVPFILALVVGQAFGIPTADANEPLRLLGLVLGSCWMFLIGLIDDRWDLPAWVLLTSQLIASGIAIATLIFIERVNNPLTDDMIIFGPILIAGLTTFWIAGMINTVNFLDGLDGLAAGVGAILCIVLAIHMHQTNQPSVALLPLALLGSAVGFLLFNFDPARVFMGSAGAFFLGYALGCLGIIAGARVATVLLVMWVPVVDVAWQILSRVSRGQSLGEGDRGHLHFRLLDLGLPQRAIVLSYWVFCALLGVLALGISSRIYKLVALILLTGLLMAAMAYLTRKKP